MRRHYYATSNLVLKSAAEWRIASFTMAARSCEISAATAGSQISEDLTGSCVTWKESHSISVGKKQLKQEVSSEDTDGDWSEWRGLRVITVSRGTCRSANKLGIVDGRIHYMAGWTINLCVFWGVTRGGSAGPLGATRGSAHTDLLTLNWFWFKSKKLHEGVTTFIFLFIRKT